MTIYIQKLKEISLHNKYTKWYISICEAALARFKYDHNKHKDTNRNRAKQVLGYVEIHHILPKSFGIGGEFDSNNYVVLTAREHYIVHLLATKMFEFGSPYYHKMLKGYSYMLCAPKVNGDRYSSRKFSKLREDLNKLPGPTKGKVILSRRIKVTLNGIEFPSVTEAANYFGVSHASVGKWVKKGLQEVNPKTHRHFGKPITIDGKTYRSLSEASSVLNIPSTTFQRHVRQNKYNGN